MHKHFLKKYLYKVKKYKNNNDALWCGSGWVCGNLSWLVPPLPTAFHPYHWQGKKVDFPHTGPLKQKFFPCHAIVMSFPPYSALIEMCSWWWQNPKDDDMSSPRISPILCELYSIMLKFYFFCTPAMNMAMNKSISNELDFLHAYVISVVTTSVEGNREWDMQLMCQNRYIM